MKKKTYIIIIISLCFQACGLNKTSSPNIQDIAQNPNISKQTEITTEVDTQETVPTNSSGLSFKIIPVEGGGYGYEVLKGQNPLIRQLTIPGRAGNQGFATEALAEKIAKVVIHKIKHYQMPPSVTSKELDSLGVH